MTSTRGIGTETSRTPAGLVDAAEEKLMLEEGYAARDLEAVAA